MRLPTKSGCDWSKKCVLVNSSLNQMDSRHTIRNKRFFFFNYNLGQNPLTGSTLSLQWDFADIHKYFNVSYKKMPGQKNLKLNFMKQDNIFLNFTWQQHLWHRKKKISLFFRTVFLFQPQTITVQGRRLGERANVSGGEIQVRQSLK